MAKGSILITLLYFTSNHLFRRDRGVQNFVIPVDARISYLSGSICQLSDIYLTSIKFIFEL
jgi:hypothetical protein